MPGPNDLSNGIRGIGIAAQARRWGDHVLT
jgi:hypothetical protein